MVWQSLGHPQTEASNKSKRRKSRLLQYGQFNLELMSKTFFPALNKSGKVHPAGCKDAGAEDFSSQEF